VLASTSAAEFEQRVNVALATLKSSHVAFFHGSGTRVPAHYALNATFLKADDPDPLWLFLDVLEGGVAHKNGIQPGEALLSVNGARVLPPEVPRFDLGASTEILVRSPDGTDRTITVALPPPTAKGRPPLVEVKAVHSRKLTPDIGYVRVAYFPGNAGDRFALAYEQALNALGTCKGLVIDLRGNIGGGLGSLRAMSSLCADSRPIGFNVSRKVADQGYRKDRLIRIDHIPTTKLGLIGMFLRFKLLHRDRSVALFTEGLGPRPFHGRIAILVNQHTKSAAEMVADFAITHRLATIVGTRTAGEVLGAVNFLVGEDYRLRIPIGGWMSWDDRMLEKAIATTRRGEYTNVQYARFADDLVILIDAHPRHDWLVKAVERRLREELAKLRVEINEDKSRMVDLAKGESFLFLGFEYRRIRSRNRVWRPYYAPKLKKRTALFAKLREVFRRHVSQPVGKVIEIINPILRGWVNYFRIGDSSRCFSMVKRWVEKKVRRHLMRASGRKGMGWKRWSTEWLYNTLGLFDGYRVRRPWVPES
jgi:C-terminal processing protease CtpA/Prc